ncbi:MAG: UvrD-helicase domain-containing protein [Gallionella sp.]|jgi:ATP-dependent helicase/nuclease subunit A
MNNNLALNPHHSVVVEACAGSGKTWLLVSRIVRLLLAGVQPGEILAITFTRKAAQEMQARLHEWLHFLAVHDDDEVRKFLRERGMGDSIGDDIDNALLAKARGLYRDALLAQPALTINTFHGWFMQLIQRAPLNAGVPVGMQLLERTAALRDEAWQAFADSLHTAPDGETAQFMQWLFTEYGLHSTRVLLENFVHKRAEWWAYTQGQKNAVAWATEQLRNEFEVDFDDDPITQACTDAALQAAVHAFAQALATGTETQCNHSTKLQAAWQLADPHQRFATLTLALYTQADEPRSFKPTKKQNAETFLLARDVLFDKLQAVRDALIELQALRMNQAALHCGAALLQHYQELKLRSQQMDFTDLEWQVCHMLNQSDCAEYMQYKLDSRYRHVLLDEFQDTNPLQWQILQSWFAASAAVDSRPTVFVVGDPKQSIYRFRRADARLFGEVREFLQREFGAHYLTQNETRRNAPAVLAAVNGVFSEHPDGFVDFEEHVAHYQDLLGHVEVLPLAVAEATLPLPPGEGWGGGASDELLLRNPLTTPREEKQSGAREFEAEQFAARIADIVANWSVQDDGNLRRAEYRDIMVLVRKRTHLRVYEHALRARHIPFLSSRRGGLLDTLEAEDIQALLTFLITPFADLELAQALRSPIFSCSDTDLMRLAEISPHPHPNPPLEGEGTEFPSTWNNGQPKPGPPPEGESVARGLWGGGGVGSWWMRLQRCVQTGAASPQLQRAHRLLQSWLPLADKLPVHDLLDRIYFEGDLLHRYAAALPAELHGTVRANLHAFMEIALNVDAGRYPSLPRFLAELRELRAAENESPDEGKVGEVGNALRIYTVHEAKGLEAPIVWLLDANDTHHKTDSYNVLLAWPPNESRPAHFSLFSDKRGRGAKRAPYFDADEAYARREEMNLLYVAMTRAKQGLLVSGHGEPREVSWYGRVAAVVQEHDNPLLDSSLLRSLENETLAVGSEERPPSQSALSSRLHGSDHAEQILRQPIPTGQRVTPTTLEQRRGIWLHALLEQRISSYAQSIPLTKEALQQRCAIPLGEMDALWQHAQALLEHASLQRFFDPQHYLEAHNEMPYVNARGELKRIDRLVEFHDEVWVLDYKTGDSATSEPYHAQLTEYRTAMQTLYPTKKVCCALLFLDGQLHEIK